MAEIYQDAEPVFLVSEAGVPYLAGAGSSSGTTGDVKIKSIEPGVVIPVSDNGGSLTVDGSVSVANFPSSQNVAVSNFPATQAVSGTLTVNTHAVTQSGVFSVTPVTPTAFTGVSTASTNATSVKTSAGNVYAVTVSNVTASAVYFKFYNKASAPTVGTDVPIMTIPIPANSVIITDFGSVGQRFVTGVAYAVTGAISATDTTAVTAGVQVAGVYL